MSASGAALFVTVAHVGMIVSQLPLGAVLDRVNRWMVAGACLLIAGITFGLFAVVPVTSWLIWPLAALCGSAFFGVYTAGISLLGEKHTGGELVAGSAAFAMAYAVGGAVGTPVTGAALAWEPSAGLDAAGLCRLHRRLGGSAAPLNCSFLSAAGAPGQSRRPSAAAGIGILNTAVRSC